MAGFLLRRGASAGLVRTLSEKLRYRRDQRIFYSWPTLASVQAWRRQPGDRNFIYTVKVCELITHVKRFKSTKTLVKDFGLFADNLGDRKGCFLFQLPPSYRYTRRGWTRLSASSTRRGATLWNSGVRAGGMKMSTAPSVKLA